MGEQGPPGGRNESDEHFSLTRLGGWWQDEQGGEHPEKRRYARVRYVARLRMVPGDNVVRECEAEDISLGGMLLRFSEAQRQMAVGQLVELTLTDAGGAPLRLDGEIVRHQDTDRFGVRFMNVTGAQRDALLQIIGGAAVSDAAAGTEYVIAKRREK